MDDVGQLVAQENLEPVVVVAQLVVAVGRHRAHVHERVGQRGGEAVGVVVHVGEHDLHAARAHAVPPLVRGEDLGGQRRRLPRHGLEALVVVHRHPLRGQGPEAKARGKARGGRAPWPRGRQDGQDPDAHQSVRQARAGPKHGGRRVARRCTIAALWHHGGPAMPLTRRRLLQLSSAATLGAAVPARAAAPESLPAAIAELNPMTEGVSAIGPDERKVRIARAQKLMAEEGLDAVVLASGTSLAYLTGAEWGLSERFFGAVLLREGEPAWVTPAFEKERALQQIHFGRDVRAWEEHESPYALVAGILRDGKAAGRIGI
ncbi:MAG: hypothetical protein DMF82_06145, partial [Acidobacteria bacterium]